jgi:hypothetical protein
MAAGYPIYCNSIKGGYSVERARRIIEERTHLTLGEAGPFRTEGRDDWLAVAAVVVVPHALRFVFPVDLPASLPDMAFTRWPVVTAAPYDCLPRATVGVDCPGHCSADNGDHSKEGNEYPKPLGLASNIERSSGLLQGVYESAETEEETNY